jgi:hypothetical protein
VVTTTTTTTTKGAGRRAWTNDVTKRDQQKKSQLAR